MDFLYINLLSALLAITISLIPLIFNDTKGFLYKKSTIKKISKNGWVSIILLSLLIICNIYTNILHSKLLSSKKDIETNFAKITKQLFDRNLKFDIITKKIITINNGKPDFLFNIRFNYSRIDLNRSEIVLSYVLNNYSDIWLYNTATTISFFRETNGRFETDSSQTFNLLQMQAFAPNDLMMNQTFACNLYHPNKSSNVFLLTKTIYQDQYGHKKEPIRSIYFLLESEKLKNSLSLSIDDLLYKKAKDFLITSHLW
jgi:hypothetical protein